MSRLQTRSMNSRHRRIDASKAKGSEIYSSRLRAISSNAYFTSISPLGPSTPSDFLKHGQYYRQISVAIMCPRINMLRVAISLIRDDGRLVISIMSPRRERSGDFSDSGANIIIYYFDVTAFARYYAEARQRLMILLADVANRIDEISTISIGRLIH